MRGDPTGWFTQAPEGGGGGRRAQTASRDVALLKPTGSAERRNVRIAANTALARTHAVVAALVRMEVNQLLGLEERQPRQLEPTMKIQNRSRSTVSNKIQTFVSLSLLTPA